MTPRVHDVCAWLPRCPVQISCTFFAICPLGRTEVPLREAMPLEGWSSLSCLRPQNTYSRWRRAPPPPSDMQHHSAGPPIPPLRPTHDTGPTQLLSVGWKPSLASYGAQQWSKRRARICWALQGRQPLFSSLQLKGSQCLSWSRKEKEKQAAPPPVGKPCLSTLATLSKF
jgi:hypothetical protein